MRSRAAVVLSGLLIQGVVPPAHAQPSEADGPRNFVLGGGSCPSDAEVTRETLRLTPPSKHDAYGSNVRVMLEDLGDSYHLQIFAPELRAEKTYVDPSRDCTRRARFAAVLVVLTLMPPQVAVDDETVPTSASAPPAASKPAGEAQRLIPKAEPPQGAPLRSDWFHFELGAAVRWSPPILDSPELLTPGAVLHGSFGPGRFRGFVAAGHFRNTAFELLGVAAQMRRTSFAVGLALSSVLGALSLTGELGVVAAFTRIQGSGLLSSQTHSALHWGSHFGGHVTLAESRLSPIWGASLDAMPSPSELVMAPRGRLGKTPSVELTTYLGGRIGF